MFKRTKYLEKRISSIGNGRIKIITGPRRSGKSYLRFRIFKSHLLDLGVKEDHILSLKLDQKDSARYRSLDEFTSYFKKNRIKDGKTMFFLIDEIQLVEKKENPYVKGDILTFYDALNEFLEWENTEIFVTGSNSHRLSSDIATEFRGRGWLIHRKPLSFSEIREATPSSISDFELYDAYWKYGGLPECVLLKEDERKRQYLSSVFLTTYLKDIAERNGLKDETSLKELTSFLASSVGSLVSPNKIANTFQSKEQRKIAPNTIRRYLGYLEDSFMVYEAQRYDLKRKSILNGSRKIYFADRGIRNAAAQYKGRDQESHFRENIIYNELLYRGFLCNVGVIENIENKDGKSRKIIREVDFVAEKNDKRLYIQSAFLIDNADKLKQEKTSLMKTKDAFPKIIISKFTSGSSYDEDGVLHVGLFDFLLGKEPLLN